MTPQQTQSTIDVAGHASAWGALAGWFVGLLPSLATLLTVIWFTILIVEKVMDKKFVEIVRCAGDKIHRLWPGR